MDQNQNISQGMVKYNRKYAERALIFWTVIYCILFPFLFYMAMFSAMVFDNPSISTTMGLSVMGVVFLIPLSIPVSIYFMWSSYFKRRYKKFWFFCRLPPIILLVVLSLDILTSLLNKIISLY